MIIHEIGPRDKQFATAGRGTLCRWDASMWRALQETGHVTECELLLWL